LPWTKYSAPAYYRLPPVNAFIVAGPGIIVAAHYGLASQQAAFATWGVYYVWGVNLLVYTMRGGHWLANLLILAAGALHPATLALFIFIGIVDNLLDLRRLSSVLGLDVEARPVAKRPAQNIEPVA